MSNIALNNSNKIEMWLNNNCIYTSETSQEPTGGELWYGVKFTGNSNIGVRTGNLEFHKTLPIQSLMRGCIIRNNINGKEGLIGYLKANNWSQYEDGTFVQEYAEANVMVEIPEFYLKFIRNNEEDSDEIRISMYPLDGFVKSKKMYVGAYEGFTQRVSIDGSSTSANLLYSTMNVEPTVSITREDFQKAARVNGSAHWNMYTYAAHKAITWLFIVEYANRNCQDTYNAELTAEGYHQGGLGMGVTNRTITIGGVTKYNYVVTGVTDSLGNNSGIVSHTVNGDNDTSITVDVPRYRGIENPFGHVWKNCIDVIYSSDDDIYLCDDYNKFGNDKTLYTLSDIKEPQTQGYVKQLSNNDAGDLFCTETSTDANRYYADYTYPSTSTSDRTLRVGGGSDAGSIAGLFCLNSYGGLGNSYAYVGSRLTYLI